MRTMWAEQAPNDLTPGAPTRRRAFTAGPVRLAERALAAMPMPVALVDGRARLHYWNDQAASLFRAPSLLSVEKPDLHTMLGRIGRLTEAQRDRIAAFVEGTVSDEDSGVESCLCLSFGKAHRVAIRIRAVEPGIWMMLGDYWEPFRRRMHAPVRQER